jgi:RHH-type rel operon transcriptional repressor/antitoxin RelB
MARPGIRPGRAPAVGIVPVGRPTTLLIVPGPAAEATSTQAAGPRVGATVIIDLNAGTHLPDHGAGSRHQPLHAVDGVPAPAASAGRLDSFQRKKPADRRRLRQCVGEAARPETHQQLRSAQVNASVPRHVTSLTCIAGGDLRPSSIRLTAEVEARLDALAARTGRSRTLHVRQAITAHMHELEELYWADEAVREWEGSGQKSRPAGQRWDELGVCIVRGLRPHPSSTRHHAPWIRRWYASSRHTTTRCANSTTHARAQWTLPGIWPTTDGGTAVTPCLVRTTPSAVPARTRSGTRRSSRT